MSQLSVNTITNAAGGNTAQINGMTPTADSLQGFRNRILNGGMVIDQRNTGAAVTASGSFPVDRWVFSNSTDGAVSLQQDSAAPAGFVNSIKHTTTTADGTLTATQLMAVIQFIEGLNVADLGWGTANAQSVTLSFWARSSLTGTFGGSIRNNGATRSYPFSYAISTANTWEYKTVTIPGDTTGTWLTTNGIGMSVNFGLGAGPDRSGTAGAWAGSNIIAPTGSVNVMGTLNATWQITGVQLEAGSVATPFERRPYGTELALCQRYYYRAAVNSSGTFSVADGNLAYTTLSFKVSMRATPSAAWVSGGNISAGANNGAITGGVLISGTTHSPEVVALQATGGSGVSTGQGVILYNSPIWQFSAEL